MTDREMVIRAMECCAVGAECDHCPYSSMNQSGHEGCYQMHADALALLKGSYTPQEVYDTVIEHAQHDMRFKLGDKIDYSVTDVVDILNMELMCKAGDM